MSAPQHIIALIPARAGSKRVQAKNIRRLGGHPMIAYTIAAARQSGVFDEVYVSTDTEEIASIARHYGATVPFLRPAEYAADKSPDIEWLAHMLGKLQNEGKARDCFALLRPTSPFRQAETIQRAWKQFSEDGKADSLRAVELCEQHPGKMWEVDAEGNRMVPLLKDGPKNPPWHSTPYQALPKVYIQNASLEIAWTRIPLEQGTIAGEVIMPFITNDTEGFDINNPQDWWLAEHLLANGDATLPQVEAEPYPQS